MWLSTRETTSAGEVFEAWMPDSRRFLYSRSNGSAGRSLWVWDVEHGIQIVQLLRPPDGSKLALRSFDRAWIVRRPRAE